MKSSFFQRESSSCINSKDREPAKQRSWSPRKVAKRKAGKWEREGVEDRLPQQVAARLVERAAGNAIDHNPVNEPLF